MQLNKYENKIQYDPATEVRHKKEVFSASDVSPESPTQDSNEADHIIYHKSQEEKGMIGRPLRLSTLILKITMMWIGFSSGKEERIKRNSICWLWGERKPRKKYVG